MRFEPDLKVAEIAEAFSLDMVDLAKARYEVDLDYSLASIDHLERIAEQLASHKPMFARFRPGFAAQVDSASKALGFYLAEAIRRSMGAEHGWAIADDESRIYALRLGDGTVCWPVGRAHQRLLEGAENNLRDYVAVLASKASGG